MGLLGDAFKLGGSIIGGKKKKKASKKAIAAYEAAANTAIGTLTNAANEVVPTFKPYQEAGQATLSKLMAELEAGSLDAPDASMLGADMSLLDAPNMADFEASPDYQFRVNEALKGVQASTAGRFGLDSGVTLKALADRAGNMAGQEFGNWWERTRGANIDKFNAQYRSNADRYAAMTGARDQRYRTLRDIAGLGYSATGDVARTRLGLAGNVADTQVNIGNAKAGGIIDRGNINAANWQSVGNFFGNAAEAVASGGLSEVGRQFGLGGGSSYQPPVVNYSAMSRGMPSIFGRG